jgi:predicted DNA-binding protein with PD1-like motif
METYESAEGYVVVRLDTGDDALQSLQQACEDHKIDIGAVVSAIGTFRNLRIHYLNTDDLDQPEEDRDTILELNGSWEVSGIQGLIADGEPHLHVTAYDGERTIAGHLEEGCEINALGEVLIRRIDDLQLHRTPNEFNVATLESR